MALYLVLPVMARAFVGRRWIVELPVALAVGWLYRFVVVSTTSAWPTLATPSCSSGASSTGSRSA